MRGKKGDFQKVRPTANGGGRHGLAFGQQNGQRTPGSAQLQGLFGGFLGEGVRRWPGRPKARDQQHRAEATKVLYAHPGADDARRLQRELAVELCRCGLCMWEPAHAGGADERSNHKCHAQPCDAICICDMQHAAACMQSTACGARSRSISQGMSITYLVMKLSITVGKDTQEHRCMRHHVAFELPCCSLPGIRNAGFCGRHH